MTAPAFLNSFVDDAAIFPPGNLPLAEAFMQHRTHRASGYADPRVDDETTGAPPPTISSTRG